MSLKHHRTFGFTLIEVLISLVVLSIGLLGLAGLQNITLKYDHEAYIRTQSAYLASDMAARMRVNRDAAASYVDNTGATPSAICESSAGCSAVQMADYDSFHWQLLLRKLLPQGAGSVALRGTGPSYLITVRWGERSDDRWVIGRTHRFIMEVYP